MQSVLIEQGFSLMLYGMGVVFIFLTLLVYATGLMSYVIREWFPEKEVVAPPPRRKAGRQGNVSPLTLKIIQAAIEQHRSRR